ncbi:CaiB/BaiF CoA transferase family protein [Thalassobaculum salexigens]|uniref:CaiB/BaiF CoA transferase family protein n=1 Tax=Thalassobaculum salexigens TaxID=455360 RepID=UPI00042326CB|nr:CaiB/BaiF CoA-transferase family protein [Thalassobaculum salexigens]
MNTPLDDQGGPLSGLRILELGHFIAAPFCTRVLADLGADVIKVEPPGRGDPVRSWGIIPEGETASVWWSVHGRNKRSITADLKKPEGIALVKRLIAEVDAVVENFKPGQLASWGLGPRDMTAVNPDVIVVQVSGYGQTGPGHNRAAFGVIGEAVGGLRHLTGYPPEVSELPPVRTGISIGDSVAGLYGAIGLLAALFEKGKGRGTPGRRIDVALTESILSLLEGCLPEYGATGAVRQPTGSTLPTNAPSNAYPTADGRWFLIAANSNALFRRLCGAMGRLELADDPRYADNPSRVKHAAELDAAISHWTTGLTLDEVAAQVEAADVPCSRIYDIADIAADPQFLDRGMVRRVADPRLGEVLHPGVVPAMTGGPAGGVRWAGPDVGAHTDEVLAELLGMAPDEIDALKKEGVL